MRRPSGAPTAARRDESPTPDAARAPEPSYEPVLGGQAGGRLAIGRLKPPIETLEPTVDARLADVELRGDLLGEPPLPFPTKQQQVDLREAVRRHDLGADAPHPPLVQFHRQAAGQNLQDVHSLAMK